MYKGYKIVVNTAAGRRRYMELLVPFIMASDIVDRYDIWVNTHNGADIEFFKRLAESYHKIRLVWQPEGIVNGISSINSFYRECCDDDTIYFKMDDDLIWMEPETIKKMVDFRIDNPNYFLVSPVVINNAVSTYLLEVHNKIKLDKYYNSNANHPILWKSGDFASELHEWFLSNYLVPQKWDQLHMPSTPLGMIRFSINSILWFGKDLKKINGIIPGDDEEFLSVKYPTLIGKANCWNGNVIVSHFAFFTQREKLDSKNILEQYKDVIYSQGMNDAVFSSHLRKMSEIMAYIDEHEDSLLAHPSPYKTIPKEPVKLKTRIMSGVRKYCPPVGKLIDRSKNKQQTSGFIIK